MEQKKVTRKVSILDTMIGSKKDYSAFNNVKRQDTTLLIRIPHELKDDYVEYCKKHNKSVSDEIRRFIIQELS